MSDKQYEQKPEAIQRDEGADRHTRFRPCPKTTWCVLADGHSGGCEEINRPTRKP